MRASVVLGALADARGRGEDFDEAWPLALADVRRHCPNGLDRLQWLTALAETRWAWEDAYGRGAGRLALNEGLVA